MHYSYLPLPSVLELAIKRLMDLPSLIVMLLLQKKPCSRPRRKWCYIRIWTDRPCVSILTLLVSDHTSFSSPGSMGLSVLHWTGAWDGAGHCQLLHIQHWVSCAVQDYDQIHLWCFSLVNLIFVLGMLTMIAWPCTILLQGLLFLLQNEYLPVIPHLMMHLYGRRRIYIGEWGIHITRQIINRGKIQTCSSSRI